MGGYWRRAGEAAGSAFQAVLQQRLSRQAYPLQTHEMLFDAHSHAFRVFGGVPRRGIYDNMGTAVDRVGIGKKREINTRFAAMASHYLFDTDFCNPASGWEKRQVEKNVQDARRRLWQAMPRFATLAELNDWLEQRCQALWPEIPHGSQEGSIFADAANHGRDRDPRPIQSGARRAAGRADGAAWPKCSARVRATTTGSSGGTRRLPALGRRAAPIA